MPEEQFQHCKENIYCCDLAKQYIHYSDHIDLTLAGGYDDMVPNTEKSAFDWKNKGKMGARTDGENLLNEWQSKYPDGRIVTNKTAMEAVPNGVKILGLFDNKDITYELDKTEDQSDSIPTLAEKTKKAIDSLLEMSDEGFYLFVEGGRIDHGHHESNSHKALEEFRQFDEAIKVAHEHPKLQKNYETLIVITADHSHAFAWGGYGWRGYNILGRIPYDTWNGNEDQQAISILGYANGPGYRGDVEDKTTRENLTDFSYEEFMDKDYQQQTAAPLGSETHGGEDVAIIAKGPWSHYYTGIHEQVYVANLMMRAQCLEPYDDEPHCSSSSVFSFSLGLVLVLVAKLF